MNSLLFVSVAVMNCYGQEVVSGRSLQRCVYSHEMIVKAEELKVMTERKYLLGTVTKQISTGCHIELKNGTNVMHGKPCRNFFTQ